MDTHFAPAGRDAPEELRRRVDLVDGTPLLQMVLDALPPPVMILNQHRQILAGNRALLKLLDTDVDQLIGRRTGEVMGCTFSRGGPDGCGTTKHCLTCGAVAAVLESQKLRNRATRECRLTLDTAIDVLVSRVRDALLARRALSQIAPIVIGVDLRAIVE